MGDTLIRALQNPAVYPHAVASVTVLETHISWVLLTGSFAYKIKKPVNLGFLDFSSLEKRRHFCAEELRLNRRYAPQVYLDVVAIYGRPDEPRFTPDGPVLEYAVKMVQFDQDARLDVLLRRDALNLDAMNQLAVTVADMVARADHVGASQSYGTPEHIWVPVVENFAQIRLQPLAPQDAVVLRGIEDWSARAYARLKTTLSARREQGFVRECHGDLHTRNLVQLDNCLLAFDCIEFNANLRWIDVMSEIAFLVMDLHAMDRGAFAHRFLNAYLETSGDYDGAAVLRFYLVYRAMVRAKVARLEAQTDLSRHTFTTYLKLANTFIDDTRPYLLVMHGLSGSGKSTLGQMLVDALGVIRVRSDVERKRMARDASASIGPENWNRGLYSTQTTTAVYRRLAAVSDTLLAAGFSVVVDATFLRREYRTLLRDVAARHDVDFAFIRCQAPKDVLQRAIQHRARAGGDPSDADLRVLDMQIESQQPLDRDEQSRCVDVDASVPFSVERVIQSLRAHIKALAAPPP